MKEEKVFIPSGAIQLEGLINFHEALSFKGGVIFCHPHPQHGGDMYNPMINTAVRAASEEGFFTLRFNLRGVGDSGGSYGEGVGEKEDVKASIEYFCSRLKTAHPSLVLVGYSFGAWVGLPIAIQDERINGMVAIAPPLDLYDFGFLWGCKKRKLFIVGNQDLFCPISLFEEWYHYLEEPKSMAIIPGADHFFSSHVPLIAQPLRKFLKDVLGS